MFFPLHLTALLLFIFVTSAFASSAPPQLLGKTVVTSWSEDTAWKDVDGKSGTAQSTVELSIFVSDKGRLFTQYARRMNGQPSMAYSNGPDSNLLKTSNFIGNAPFQFNGRTLQNTFRYKSGARHIEIRFDESFQSCSLVVSYGREDGAPGRVTTAMNKRLFLLGKTSVIGPRCAVESGNRLG